MARRRRSSRGARSKRRMIACISSGVGASTKAKPFDSCVSWLRITLIESATRSSADSQVLISSAVTHTGRFPRKTVKLNCLCTPFVGFDALARWKDSDSSAYRSVSKYCPSCKLIFTNLSTMPLLNPMIGRDWTEATGVRSIWLKTWFKKIQLICDPRPRQIGEPP